MELKKEFECTIQVYKHFENITVHYLLMISLIAMKLFLGYSTTPYKSMVAKGIQPFDSKDYRRYLLEVQCNQRLGYIRRYRDINFDIEAFRGHSAFLGHYYRHLFHTVKFVVSQCDNFLSYKAKIHYLRLLRAQLSNHEQIMIFYNWLSGYGKAWENGENKFFTEFVMIHNLWHNLLIDDKFIKGKIKCLIDKPVKYREGDLFEKDPDEYLKPLQKT